MSAIPKYLGHIWVGPACPPQAWMDTWRNQHEGWDYTAYENEFLRGKSVQPILACEPGNEFVGELVKRLSSIQPGDLAEPYQTTGNYFVARMIREIKPQIIVFPSHYFAPVHFTGEQYVGSDKSYAKHMFGTTRKAYKHSNSLAATILRRRQSRYRRKVRKLQEKKNSDLFDN